MMRPATWLLLVMLVALPLRADEVPANGSAASGSARDPQALREIAPLWEWKDAELQAGLERSLDALGLAAPLAKGQLAVALVDVTDINHPRVAAVNGDRMIYAASLPKIAIMLAVFEKMETGEIKLDDETWGQLNRMIRRSSNSDSTALMHKVGKPYIAEVLASPRYKLYDPERNGGLWAGKDYAKAGLWRRDPLHNLSHGATTMQIARFYYLLETGRLTSPEASKQMKRLLADSAINHKFVKGMRTVRPSARVYRKSGTWSAYHADGALIERSDGATYIAAGLAKVAQGKTWFPQIIIAMDRLIPAPHAKGNGKTNSRRR